MRASVSFFLALLFAVTPILQVHGQVRQQGPSPPDSSAAIAPLTSDVRSVVFLEPPLAPWVPTLEASSSRWGTTDSLPVPEPLSTEAVIGLVILAIVVVGIIALVIHCSREDISCDPGAGFR